MPNEDPTVAFDSAWQRFQKQGGEELDLGETMAGSGTMAFQDLQTLVSETALAELGPAEVDPSRLDTLRIGGPAAQFEPKSLLGRGGMGEVHLAVDRSLRREVAVKTAAREGRSKAAEALLQEALFTGYLEHPNVIPVHRLGVDESGSPVMVMKRVVGTSWSELLADPEHSAWEVHPGDRLRANLRILIQVCNAVAYAHSQGVLHRDIKPSNVMLGSFGEVYLVDWGVAMRLDQRDRPGAPMVGTLTYMAPEMLEADRRGLSERTDVYLLGATLHHVLTGAPRHSGDAHYNVMLAAYRSEPHHYRAVPAELADLCNRACSADPAQRPESAAAFRGALEEFLEHQGSLDLVRKADKRLTALQREYKQPSDSDGRAAASLLAACRFGYEQALEAWAGNEAAQDGLQLCLELALERELAARNRGLAASLLAGLPRPRPDLEERLKALEAELDAEAEGQRKLEALEHDLSLEVSAEVRTRSMWLMAVVAYLTLAGFAALVVGGFVRFGYAAATAFGGLIGGVLLANLALNRERLLANTVNRRIVHMVGAAWVAGMLHLVLCWVYAIPVWILFLYVGVIMVAFGLQMAAAVDWRMWIILPLALPAMFSGLVDPTLDPLILHAVTGVVIFGAIAWMWTRRPPGS